MCQIQSSLFLASAMILVALAAVFEIVPQEMAQYAALALAFPSLWLQGRKGCWKNAGNFS